MTSDHANDAPQADPVTERHRLTGEAYGDDRPLAARQALYVHQRPQHDLPGLVLRELADATGVVLDIGCGNGTYTRRIRDARPDLTVFGLDLSAGILAGLEPPVAVADAARLPFADGRAGAALAMHMLYHVPDIAAAVDELARVLAPDGVVIASTNSAKDKRALDRLWSRSAADVLGVDRGPSRVSLSARFTLETAPTHLGRRFTRVEIIETPGIVTVRDPDPVIAHLASYRAWADAGEVPFDATLSRARERLTDIIAEHGRFDIDCLSGVLVCRP